MPNVHLHSGEFHLSVTDLRIPGRGLDFVWTRTYRSRLGRDTAIGIGWDFSYNLKIEAVGQDVRLYDGDGRADVYYAQGNGSYTAAQFFREGQFEPDGRFTLLFADSGRWTFLPLDATPLSGRIQSISDRNANTISFAYDAPTGKLLTITDTLGRVVTVNWNGSRIASITDFAGRTFAYTYYAPAEPGGSPGDLKTARSPLVTGTPNGNDFPLGKTTTYTYTTGFGDDRLNHNLATITDPRGNTWLANQYGTANTAGELRFDRLVSQRRGSVTDTIEIVYRGIGRQLKDDPEPPVVRTIVNDRVGNVREYYYDALSRLVRKLEFTGRANPNVPTTPGSNRPINKLRASDPDFFVTRYAHDANALTTNVLHPNGNITHLVYELELNPAAEPRVQGNLRELWRLPGTHSPAGDQPSGTLELFEYASGLGGCCGTNFVSKHTDARGNVTEHDYDAFGNRTETRHPTGGGIEDWTYDAFGRETTHTLADDGTGYRRRDDRQYYGPSDGAQNGYLKSSIVDAVNLALTTTYAYDAKGNVISKTDPRGNDTQLTLNSLNEVVRERSRLIAGAPSYRIEKLFSYDGNGNLTQVDVDNRNELGTIDVTNPQITTEHGFGILNERLWDRREPSPAQTVTTEFVYDANRNRTLVRKGEAFAGTQPNNTVQSLYDERDLLWRVVRAPLDPSHATDQSDYDGNGNLTAKRQGLESGEHVTTYVYDALDRRVLATDPMGNTTEHHFDPNGNVGGHVGDDSSGLHPFATLDLGQLLDTAGSVGSVRLRESMYQYDAMDRLVVMEERHFDTETQAPILDGESTHTWVYGPSSLLLSATTDGPSHQTTYHYDTASRLVVTVDAKANSTTLTHDSNGNVLSTVENEVPDLPVGSQSFTTTYTYDALDRLKTETDNRGNQTQHGYDSRDNVVLDTDPLGEKTRYAYDGLDRRIETRRDMDGNGSFNDFADIVELNSWDKSSRKTAETDDDNHTTSYAYDALDRLIVTQNADGTIAQNGSGATWILGQPQPNLSGFVPGYDAHDSIFRRFDENGSRVDSTYDGLDRVLQRTIVRAAGVLGTTLETYQYDGLSRMIRAQDNDSLIVRGSVSTSGYDSLSNVLRETQQVLPGGPQRTVTSAYDGNSNQTLLTYPGGRVIFRSYDPLDRPTLVRDDPPGVGTTVATYFYVGPWRLGRRVYGNGTRTDFTYDGITGILDPSGDFGVRKLIRTRHYTFPGSVIFEERTNLWNRVGNKTQADDLVVPLDTRAYSYDAADRLIASSSSATGQSSSYFLDGVGNRQSVSGTVDPGLYSFNVVNEYTGTPFDSRTYDANGNLKTMSNPSRTLSYDYRDQLVQYLDSSSGVTTTYRYDCLGRRIEKSVGGTVTRFYYDGSELLEEQDTSGATLATYVYSKGEHSRLQMLRAGTKYFYHEDDLGSVRAVTNASGQLVESVEYGDFGDATVTSPTPPTLFSHPPNQSGMFESDQDGGAGAYSLLGADDFTLPQSGTVTGVKWWGAYDQPPPSTDDFWIEIYADASGLPGTMIAQRHVGNAVSRTLTGNLIVGFYDEYSYHAVLSPGVALSSGVQYWVSVHANTAGYSGTFRWEQSSIGDGLIAYNYNSMGWSPTGGDLAFELELSSGTPLSGNPFLFMGRRTDPESGLTQSGARHVNHRAGRFVQRDSVDWWRYGVEHANAFTFATNNPTSTVDLTDTIASLPTLDDDESMRPLHKDPPPRIQEKPGAKCQGSCGASVALIWNFGDKPPNAYTDDEVDEARASVQVLAMRFVYSEEIELDLRRAATASCAAHRGNWQRCICNGSIDYFDLPFAVDYIDESLVLFDDSGEPHVQRITKAAIGFGWYMVGECVDPYFDP